MKGLGSSLIVCFMFHTGRYQLYNVQKWAKLIYGKRNQVTFGGDNVGEGVRGEFLGY